MGEQVTNRKDTRTEGQTDGQTDESTDELTYRPTDGRQTVDERRQITYKVWMTFGLCI